MTVTIIASACSSAIRGAKGGSDGGGQSVLLSSSPHLVGGARRARGGNRGGGRAGSHRCTTRCLPGFGRGDTPLNKEEKDDICEDNEVK